MSDTNDIENEVELEPGILPLDGWHRSHGARMVTFAGYLMPIQYEGIMAEHLWTRSQAGLFDVSHMGQLQLSGENVVAELEKLLPADIATLKPGHIRYSMLLDEEGGILDDLMVTNAGDHFFMVVNGATKWDDMGWLREQLSDDINLHYMEDHALLALQGPKAALALGRLGLEPANADVPALDALTFMKAGNYLWGKVLLGVSRSGYTGEDGFEISVPAEAVEALADALCAMEEVKPIGLGARDSLRLEAGLPLYGHDIDTNISTIGAGLGFAINKRRRAEGGFIGAARVQKELAEGAAQTRVGLRVEGRMPAREGALVYVGEQQVGVLTSGGFAPSLEAPIAMAKVDSAYAAIGTALSIEVRGKRLNATVSPMPFVPHNYYRQGAVK